MHGGNVGKEMNELEEVKVKKEISEMNERPELGSGIDAKTFRSFYYLKEELIDYCRKNGLPVSGGKIELTDRIATFLDTGSIVASAKVSNRVNAEIAELTEQTLIEDGFVCTEKHRAFFKGKIGKCFSFNVQFQKWLKDNSGKTYADAIEAYYRILQEKKQGKTVIDKQFEYNTYIRDFFEDNKGKSLAEAIICWKYKKSLRGHNRYEQSDLIALKD